MTDEYTSGYPSSAGTTGTGTTGTSTSGTGTTGTSSTGTGTTGTSTKDTAKEQASNLKEKASDAGGHLVGEAKSEAAAVTQEARRQLTDLWSQARSEVSSQAGTQQSRLAGGLTSVGGQLTQMASAPDEQNLATDLVREVGDRVDAVGRWLESHGPDEVIEEVRSFARRRPGTFLLVAAGAGVVLGRLTRGLKDASSQPSSGASTPRTAVTAEPLPVYADVVEERPLYTDDLATPAASTTTAPVPGTATTPVTGTTAAPVTSTTGWEQR